MVTSKDIQELRVKTGVGVMDCKKALEEAKCDQKKAEEILKKCGAMKALKKADRTTSQGLIESYIHDNRVGVLLELNSETDFVAKNSEFKDLAHDLAMQIASMCPKNINELKKQDFIKDPSMTIEQLMHSKIAKIGENIQIKRFVRYQLGEER